MQTSYIPYLTLNDYLPTIQSGQLNSQILDAIEYGGEQQRMFAESWAIGQVRSYLGDFFDLDIEITPTKPFNYNKKYHAGDRIIIDFKEWKASSSSEDESDIDRITYNVGDCVIVYSDNINKLGGIGYFCKEQNSDTSFDKNKWTNIGNQYDIYYIKYPYPMFFLNIEETNGVSVRGYYLVGDRICYIDNHNYECKIETSIPSNNTVIQYYQTSSIPPPNSFPNAKNNQQWKDLGEYYFLRELPFYPIENINNQQNIGIGGSGSTGGAAETTDSDGEEDIISDIVETIDNGVWELGDNRDPVLIQALVDLAVWRLHNRISPMNIPELRESNKNSSFQWLRDVQKGIQGIKCPKIQPTQIGDLSWGSNVKVHNGYR